MSTTSAVNSSSSATTASSTTSSSSSNSLDFEEFVQILATELKYQDPDDPVSGTEYVSQMAQISSLSALSSMNSTLNNATAYGLIGQTVSYSSTDTSGNTVTGTGTVKSVTVSGSSTYVNVGGTTVNYDDITKVGSDSTTTDSSSSSSSTSST